MKPFSDGYSESYAHNLAGVSALCFDAFLSASVAGDCPDREERIVRQSLQLAYSEVLRHITGQDGPEGWRRVIESMDGEAVRS